jgi:hypothetical protein
MGPRPFLIPSDRYLVFIVKVFELDGWQKSFKSIKVSSLQQELGQNDFTVYVFSSLQNDWNYVRLSNLIGTKIATRYF